MPETIKTENQYDKALARVYELMQIANPKSLAEENELVECSILIKEYELKHYPISGVKHS